MNAPNLKLRQMVLYIAGKSGFKSCKITANANPHKLRPIHNKNVRDYDEDQM